ncbi:MAG: hypothetical protein KGQ36_00055 [Rickettsiales bacterium]|nr:hypothetical protein [Rickettsiales bacterium]
MNNKIKKFFSLRIDKEELMNQLANYDTLHVNKAYRKISALIVMIIAAVSLFGIYYDKTVEVPLAAVVLSTLLYFLAAFFINKGNRVAIIIAIIFWTLGKVTQLYQIQDFNVRIMILLFWFIVIRFFWRAFEVELTRQKIIKNNKNNDISFLS